MNAYVLEHAKNNVWCEPLQDKDYVIQPARLTPNGGTLIPFNIGWHTYTLPVTADSRKYYHFYQIGKIPTHIFGLEYLTNQWTSVDSIINATDTYINLYLSNGVMLGRQDCYIQKSPWDGNLILAVGVDNTYNYGTKVTYNDVTTEREVFPANLNNQDMYIRFYTNARADSFAGRVNSTRPDDQVRVENIKTTQLNVLKTYTNKLTSLGKKVGWVLSKGRVVNLASVTGNPSNYLGHQLSAYVDETIIGTQYFKLSQTPFFTSEKNLNKTKYILKLAVDPKSLVFYNDVEYFLGTYSGGQFTGIMIPHRRSDSIVQLTNIVHAIRIDTIEDLVNQHSWLDNNVNLTIMVVIRQGGMVRGLTHQNTRIEELMTLGAAEQTAALTGINSVMPEWKAASLENDSYANLISIRGQEITDDLIFNAYGYNAITTAHQPNPLKVKPYPEAGPNWYSCQLGNALSYKPTKVINNNPIETIAYSTEGKFLERSRHHFNNAGKVAFHSLTPVGYVESYLNRYERPTLNLTEYFTSVIENHDLLTYGFAAYVTPINGTVVSPWLEVTDSDYYVIDTNGAIPKFIWNQTKLASLNLRGMVRIDNEVCYKEFTAQSLRVAGRDFLTINFPKNPLNQVSVEPGNIDIWLDDELLFEDLDYVVKWPTVHILKVAKTYNSLCRVRIGGLAINAVHDKPRETGFVKNGILSYNGRYDIRNDRNIQINVGGRLKLRSEVSFNESTGNLKVTDGQPYQIRDYTTSIESYTGKSTLISKVKAEAIDVRVMDYLSLYNVERNPGKGIVFDKRWQVMSPFINAALGRLEAGWLNTELNEPYDMGKVAIWVQDITYLLEFDPAVNSEIDLNYVRILPHARAGLVNIGLAQYRFLDLLVKTYLHNNLDLNITVGVVN